MALTLRRNRIIFATILILVPIVLLLIRSEDRDNRVLRAGVEVDPSIIGRLKDLGIRLRSAESKNDALAQHLISLRTASSLLDFNKTNSSMRINMPGMFQGNSSQLVFPSIYNYLPHLLGSKKGLSFVHHKSKGRIGVSVAFGIPTIKRDKKNYVFETIQSLISGTSREDKSDSVVIVFIAEIEDAAYAKKLFHELINRFQEFVETGYLEIVVPHKEFYPNLNNLPKDVVHHDPPERVKWRTKQNLDFAYLMMYAQKKARFYVQLEDDIIATPGYVSTIRSFALQQLENRWMLLEFSSLGFIGKLFRTSDLLALVEFVLMFHNDKPVDWLLDHFLWVKVCSPDKDNAHCNREKAQLRIRFKPSLFQHVGKESSLPGKRQNLVDKDFKKAPLFQAHLNPSAKTVTTIDVYQQHTFDRAYTGQTYFWGHTPQQGDVIRIMFTKSISLKQFFFKTGNLEHPGDIFSNASVELLTTKTRELLVKDGHRTAPSGDAEARKRFFQSEFKRKYYIQVGRFKNGVAAGSVPVDVGDVSELMIRVNNHTGQNWVIMSEVHLVTTSK